MVHPPPSSRPTKRAPRACSGVCIGRQHRCCRHFEKIITLPEQKLAFNVLSKHGMIPIQGQGSYRQVFAEELEGEGTYDRPRRGAIYDDYWRRACQRAMSCFLPPSTYSSHLKPKISKASSLLLIARRSVLCSRNSSSRRCCSAYSRNASIL